MSDQTAEPTPTRTRGPLIPEEYIDVPSQRRYYLSLGLLCQAIKIFDFLQYTFSPPETSPNYAIKWILVDFIYCTFLAQLRIPRLNYSTSIVLLQIGCLWFINGLLFGGIQLNLSPAFTGRATNDWTSQIDLFSKPEYFRLANVLGTLGLGFFVPSRGSSGKDANLLGQHTVRMSPIGTAQLNPDHLTFCLGESGSNVLVPVLLNNTDLSYIKYSLTPLGYLQDVEENDKVNKVVGKPEYHELSKRDLKVIQQAQEEIVRSSPSSLPTQRDDGDFDEYEEEEELERAPSPQTSLQKTQSLQYIRLTKPGIFRLERVVDSSNVDARISYPAEVTIVPCPRVEFAEDKLLPDKENLLCHGQDRELDLMIDIYGVTPLSLRWFKEINGQREHFLVEGIEGVHEDRLNLPKEDLQGQDVARRLRYIPRNIKIPLSISLDARGKHLYALEDVMDGVGNIVRVSDPLTSNLWNDRKFARNLTVLRRPSFSFQGCRSGNPTSLLIGSEVALTASAIAADPLDGPWELLMKYTPPPLTEENGKNNAKRYKPWKRTARTPNEKTELTIQANAPGEYTLLKVKGKFCEGDILAPEVCKVFERPMPSAEIEWKRIHECSGDTGVSASLVFHGIPPFTVHYRTQRNKEPVKELSRIYTTSRGELTLQPPYSGHYTYTFTSLSDAYYKSVPLNGPSIDQVVHPLAAASFVNAVGTGAKKLINSCSGNLVDVDVELLGNGPWNLELQAVGPKSSDMLDFPGISESRKTLQIPIPAEINKDGGSFEVAIASVEDANGCKREVTTPGIIVNVRRVKPTARFYGSENKRQITILAGERAQLPLRLTGDGPWRVVYRHIPDNGDPKTLMAKVSSLNGYIEAAEPGLYEIASVLDVQCPGTVLLEAATFRVQWVPKPSARLSPRHETVFERYNRSHILPPICEGTDEHVDLELTGRPPFRIIYNVAKVDGIGGIEPLDQLTFTSIQHRTRFQLRTSTVGRIVYEVKQIGDAAYPLSKDGTVLSWSDRLLFEQQVMQRPTARFKSLNRLSYCLHDTLTSRGSASADGVINLEGTPPFIVKLSIKSLASSEVQLKEVKVHDKAWKIDIPSYTFKSKGPHLLKIESVQDKFLCEQAPPDPLAQSLWVDVAEIAAIIPIDRKEDFCVGDVAQFQLEGIPPWTIGFRINSKSHVQEAKASPFSLPLHQPGEFTMTSIAHRQKMCKAAVTDLKFAVHALPSAQVGHGKRIYQDILEGDQAEIVFTLIGEPPFTFTYQRSEPPSQPGGRPGKVLETHTVSGVTTKEYSIFSALEGTWTVASISDRYCRYPPVPLDGRLERTRYWL